MDAELRKKLRKIMLQAEFSGAWKVAIMLARCLDDAEAADRYADKFVDMIKWHIVLTERTPERLAKEKEKILAEIK